MDLLFILIGWLASIIFFFWKMYELFNKKALPSKKVKRQSNASVKVIPSAFTDPRKVKPDNTSLYLRKGWVQNGNSYYGYYNTIYGAWAGEIIRRGDIFNVYIIDPPLKQLKRHPKALCIDKLSKHKCSVHLRKQPKDRNVDGIIFYIEQILTRSHQLL